MATHTATPPRPPTTVPQPIPPPGALHTGSSSTTHDPMYANPREQVANKDLISPNGPRPPTCRVALPLPHVTYNLTVNMIGADPRPEDVLSLIKGLRPEDGPKDSMPGLRSRRPGLLASDAPRMITLGSGHGKRTFAAVEEQQEVTTYKRRKPEGATTTQVNQANAQEGLPISWDEFPVTRKQMPTTIVNAYPSVKRSESESSRLNSPAMGPYEPVDRLLRPESEFPEVPVRAEPRTSRVPTLDLRDASRNGWPGYRRDMSNSRSMGPPPIPGPPAPARAPSRARLHTPIPSKPYSYPSPYSSPSRDMQPPPPPPMETVQVNGYNFPVIPPAPSSSEFEARYAQQDNMAHYMPREQERYERSQHSHNEERACLRPADWSLDERDGGFFGGPDQS
ncbi:hypothetical protein FKP32DRAFT_1594965 [Trametes sanguinea]|nr:hypothetical protein FKP32DRAFT_1594965 [Trametes sanguinea]